MYVLLNPKSNVPIYEQIVREVRERIIQGIVKPGDKVPSIRELSAELMVNPNTVSKAYKELERSGIFVTLRGKGTFINEDVKDLKNNAEKQKVQERAKRLVVDSIYAGIDGKELISIIEEYYIELRRDKE
ncbi:GntR family transcriptional regulator [Salirhabdus euzebyi]|uniref:GntR family transcriptional regulator n=1 Tax=Salirhabdus euzebyi TaxID=394506 RepID=A0A841Q545_9BACI|nr:GntR family transcriptional regulator [Salirhabdus euzebyi]MBB6453515.1 GntR family transcriptional regulator [Salirhabdus euzebyi]